MSGVLLDTHAWAWSLTAAHRLSANAKGAIESAEAVCISAISFYEIGQKVRLGKWPEIAPNVLGLPDMARRQGLRVIEVSLDISLSAALVPWDHRDPFDRIILATAWAHDLALISADAAFDELGAVPNRSARIW